MAAEPVVVERTYTTPVIKVWEALTDTEQLKQWYFYLPSFTPEVGFSFQFEGGKDEKKYQHLCVITEVIPEKKLSYSWKYAGYQGNSLVTFELFPEGLSTRVRLSHEGFESFPADNPDFAKDNFAAGWNYIIGSSLANFLTKAE
jgi:uncharacterized protein YndB with AHSA1/START domain